MRKLLLAAVGAISLAGGATAASAAVVVNSSSGVTVPTPVALFNPITNKWTINFGQDPITTSPYSASFTFTTDAAYSANITSSSSTSGAEFTQAVLTGSGLPSGGLTFSGLNTMPAFVSLFNAPLVAGGMYTASFTLTNAAAFTGNTTLTAVPEPATWAMMLLGFGAVGMVIRRRRKPVLAQLA